MVIGLALIVSGCTAAESPVPPPPGALPPSNEAGPLPQGCTNTAANTATEPEQANTALAQAQPGSTVCLSGDGLTGAELELTASGTRQQPITIISDGATMRSLDVKADYVVIEGLTLRDGDGLTMQGSGLVARNNVIYNATQDGLACVNCVDALIESNTVQRADGTGIYLAGERITLRNNTVSESVLRTQGDADGIRFFGAGHQLIGNTIKDIKASGYGDEGGARGTPSGETAILFEGNTCEVNGSQAVLLENFPHVIVRGNRFSGPGTRAVQLSRGSTDCAVIGNTVTGRMRPFQIDPESEPGFQEFGNSER